jgi:hypothetical protein
MEIALSLVDEAALQALTGNAQRIVGADGVARLDDSNPGGRPRRLELNEIRPDANPPQSDGEREPPDAPAHNQYFPLFAQEQTPAFSPKPVISRGPRDVKKISRMGE